MRAACETLRERLAEVAARRFGLRAGGRAFSTGGRVRAKTDAQTDATFADVVGAGLPRARLAVRDRATTARPTSTTIARAARGKPFHYFAYGAAVSEVEVDGFTGQYRLLRVDILHDVGDSLSPLVDRGQIEGGFVQGVGWLTTEELVWTRRRRARDQRRVDLQAAVAGRVPAGLPRRRCWSKAHEPGVVHGSKAVGEPPLMLAISVREALRDAVAAFGRGGVVELALPVDARGGVLGDRTGSRLTA